MFRFKDKGELASRIATRRQKRVANIKHQHIKLNIVGAYLVALDAIFEQIVQHNVLFIVGTAANQANHWGCYAAALYAIFQPICIAYHVVYCIGI